MADRLAAVVAAVLRERKPQVRSPERRSPRSNAMKVDDTRVVVELPKREGSDDRTARGRVASPQPYLPRVSSRFVLRFRNRNNGGSRF